MAASKKRHPISQRIQSWRSICLNCSETYLHWNKNLKHPSVQLIKRTNLEQEGNQQPKMVRKAAEMALKWTNSLETRIKSVWTVLSLKWTLVQGRPWPSHCKLWWRSKNLVQVHKTRFHKRTHRIRSLICSCLTCFVLANGPLKTMETAILLSDESIF